MSSMPFPYRLAHGGVADRLELGVEETLGGVELGDDPDRAEREERDLDSLDGERVVLEFVVEFPDPVIEFGDGLARHGPGGIEQEQAGAPRLGVLGKGHRSEGLLVGEVNIVAHFESP